MLVYLIKFSDKTTWKYYVKDTLKGIPPEYYKKSINSISHGIGKLFLQMEIKFIIKFYLN